MSVISLDAQAIESLNQEIISLDNSLIQNYLPELESELNAINGNVKGDEINPIINTILSQFQGVKSSLSTEMPKLEAFLEQQIKSYTHTEEELETELQTVMNRMTVLADRVNGVKFGTTPSGNGGANGEDVPGTPGDTENNGSGLGGKVASGAVTGAAVLGTLTAVKGIGIVAPAAAKVCGAIGNMICPGVGAAAGVVIGAGAGALIGAAAPVVLNTVGKGLEAAGSWLDSIF